MGLICWLNVIQTTTTCVVDCDREACGVLLEALVGSVDVSWRTWCAFDATSYVTVCATSLMAVEWLYPDPICTCVRTNEFHCFHYICF